MALAGITFSLSEFHQYKIVTVSVAVLSLLCLICFYFVEKNSPSAIIPIHIFKNHGFLLGLIVYVGAVSFHWPILFFMPLYLHNVAGYSTEISALLLSVMTMMTIIAPYMAGKLFDKEYKGPVVHGIFILNCLSLALFYFLNIKSSLVLIIVSFILYGLAWGFGNGIATPIALSQLSKSDDAGAVSGALTTALNLCAILALAVSNTLFQWQQQVSVNLPDSSIFILGTQKIYLFLLVFTVIFWLLATRIIKA